MRNRLTVPVLASVLSVIAILATAGPVFACTPPTITLGTCQYNVQTQANEHHWTLQAENYPAPAVLLVQWSSTGTGGWSSVITLPTYPATYDLPTDASVSTLYVKLSDGEGGIYSKPWSGACPTTPTITTTLSKTEGHIGDSVRDRATLGPAGFTGTGTVT